MRAVTKMIGQFGAETEISEGQSKRRELTVIELDTFHTPHAFEDESSTCEKFVGGVGHRVERPTLKSGNEAESIVLRENRESGLCWMCRKSRESIGRSRRRFFADER